MYQRKDGGKLFKRLLGLTAMHHIRLRNLINHVQFCTRRVFPILAHLAHPR